MQVVVLLTLGMTQSKSPPGDDEASSNNPLLASDSGASSIEDYARRVAESEEQLINQEMQNQGIDGEFTAQLVTDPHEANLHYRQVRIIGRTLADYTRIAWMYLFYEIFLSVVAQVSSSLSRR